ncbi:MAG: hypothetical protein AMJ60_12310 [Desulfobacterales bacterium SG8_35]|nr:MAG: hypothetical protein AMJ60_12310 [Desulfobacterales bacterium SG8_35]
MFVHDFLLNSARLFPDKTAIIHAGDRYTYTDVLAASSSIANWLLKSNLEPGFRATILTDEPFEYITSYFAILMVGGIAVGMNTQTSERSLRTILNDCRPSVMFAHEKFRRYLEETSDAPFPKTIVINGSQNKLPAENYRKWLDRSQTLTLQQAITVQAPEITPSSIAQIIYTSGTTASPKGVMLRHSNLVALPFFYSYGNSILLTHIAVGGSLVVEQNFLYPNVILDQMINEQVTGFSGVPSTFAILINRSDIRNYSFPNLRYITQAGAAMSPQLAHKLKEILPGTQIFIMYGQTEASPRLSYLDPKEIFRKPDSIGKAIPGVNLQLLDESGNPVRTGEVGEIVANGDNIMAGYWGKPDETAKVLRPEGLWTGDLAKMDSEGFLYIVSRKSDMIKSGSHRIAPKEIEEVINEHEAVHEVAVVGIKDELLGETIKACIVLKNAMFCSTKEIALHCKKNLPAYKIPHQIEFLQELPRTSTGKICKNKLC